MREHATIAEPNARPPAHADTVTPPRQSALPMRPRTTGELLDDAWRLCLTFYPQLLLMQALFLVPAFASLLTLLVVPASPAWTLADLLPPLVATLFVLTGLGSGACQTWLRRYAQDEPLAVTSCLFAALRSGVHHCVAQTLLIASLFVGVGCLIVPGLVVWMAGVGLHALIVEGKGSSFADLEELQRELGSQPGKTSAVVLSRLPLLLLTIANLHVLLQALMWTASNLAALDVTFFGAQLVLSNPLYVVSLSMFAWMLLTPYAECANFLLHLDTRVRREGLDLLYRVGRLFPATAKSLALALGGWLLLSGGAQADDAQTIQRTRHQVRQIYSEIRTSDPYPGSGKWVPRLEAIGQELQAELQPPSRVRWFGRAIHEFGTLDRNEALQVVKEIETRLERSGKPPLTTEDLKEKLRPLSDEDRKPREDKKPKSPEDHPEQPVEQAPPPERPTQAGPRTQTPQGQGLDSRGWWFVLSVVVVLVAAALWLSLKEKGNKPPGRRNQNAGRLDEPQAIPEPAPHERSSEDYWREANRLADAGRHREAVRVLYLMVLGMLHRARLMKYAPPRTNGEYLREVRLASHASSTIQEPFRELIGLFERKWYGDKTCAPDEYRQAKDLAESLRAQVEGR